MEEYAKSGQDCLFTILFYFINVKLFDFKPMSLVTNGVVK
jgi:hypothetical protein